MGRDKAMLPLQGQTLLKRAVNLLRSLGLPVTAVISPGQSYPSFEFPAIQDDPPGRGPLGGLYAALRHSSARSNIVLACDLPLLPARLFQCLRGHNLEADIVVPVDSTGSPHPLAAVYRRNCLPSVEERLEGEDLSLKALLTDSRLQVRRVGPEEHRVPDGMFMNVNTPEDWRRVLQRG